MTSRAAYTAEEKVAAVSLAFEVGVPVAAEKTGINRNSIRSWISRRRLGLPLNATPQVHPRHSANERPVSPELPEGVTTVDEAGRIRTPRSLYISVADSKGWYWADINNGKRGLFAVHRAVAMWAVLERVNVGLGEPAFREIVGIVPRGAIDQEVMVDECFYEGDLDCIIDGRCLGHFEDYPVGRTEEVVVGDS